MSSENYKPTRTEWLALSMQAWIPMLLSQMRRLYPTEGVDDVRAWTLRENDPLVLKKTDPLDAQIVARELG